MAKKTKDEIVAGAQKILGETTGVFYDSTALSRWYNDACDYVAERTRCIKGAKSVTTTSATSYAIDTVIDEMCIDIERADYYYATSTSWEEIEITTPEDLNKDYPGWKSTTAATPTHLWVDFERNEFCFYPVPATADQGTNYCKIYYTAAHGTDKVDIPMALYGAVEAHMVVKGLESRGDTRRRADSFRKDREEYIGRYLSLRAPVILRRAPS